MPPQFSLSLRHLTSQRASAGHPGVDFSRLIFPHAPPTPDPSPPLARARGGRGAEPPRFVRRAIAGSPSLALDLADGADRRLDALGVGIPELGEFRLVHIGEVLA